MSKESNAATFRDLGLDESAITVLSELAHDTPTPIQQKAIPAMLAGRDLVGQAATGTGKTAAFGLPILQMLRRLDSKAEGERGANGPRAVVLVPTRELALQVSSAIARYGRGDGVRIATLVGGQPMSPQRRALERGASMVVATPGRALDHLRRGSLDLTGVSIAVLDEADEMLDMGFVNDIEALLETMPADRQTALFSATMPRRVEHIASKYLTNPERIRIEQSSAVEGSAPMVSHRAVVVTRANKPAAIIRLLAADAPASAIVFCRTRDDVDSLASTLNEYGVHAEAVHGGLSQSQRERVVGRLRDEQVGLVVATDVAARGLDISHLTHVVNVEIPSSPETYIHRSGRVGRAGKTGIAITLVEPREHRRLIALERATRQSISVELLPSPADVRSRRTELLAKRIRGVLERESLEELRPLAGELVATFTAEEVALGALRLLHKEASTSQDDVEFPSLELGKPVKSEKRGEKRPGKSTKSGRFEKHSSKKALPSVFVGVGSRSGVTVRDLMNVMKKQTSLSARDIGHIELAPSFALIEIPSERIDDVIIDLRGASVCGRPLHARRDRKGSRK